MTVSALVRTDTAAMCHQMVYYLQAASLDTKTARVKLRWHQGSDPHFELDKLSWRMLDSSQQEPLSRHRTRSNVPVPSRDFT
jgi:hypothetical protein